MNEKNKPVIFLAFANDQDDRVGYLRNLPEEARQIREPLQRARSDGLCELVELANASADDIFRVFQSPEYRDRIAIFHYAGHANGYELLLESSGQKTTAASAEGLANFLGQQTGLQLVFLNGCSTQQQVQGLLQASVAAVIATSRAIDDHVAMQFSSRFYHGLAGGAGLRRAFNEAEAVVATTQGGQTRGAYFGDAKQEMPDADRWPWDMYIRAGAETVADWSLPEAAGDPLFGLPALPAEDLPPCPYRHLHWFGPEHSEIFFGRGHQIRELYDLITSEDTAPVVLLYGQSGVGKSSILAAGLIPRLTDSFEVIYVRRNQQSGLLKTLKASLIHGGTEATSRSIHFAADWLGIEKRLGKPLLVIVDQIEECYSRPNPDDPQEMDDFLNEIQNIFGDRQSRPRGKMILGFRKEWLAEIERRIQERRLPRAKVFLERLGSRGIVEAVIGPGSTERLQKQYHLTVEDDLAEMISDDLLDDRESAIAPTLQILLTTMWHKATEINESKPRFDKDLYRSLKSRGILLQDFLDQQLEELRKWQEDVIESGLALDLLAHHTTPMGTANVRSVDELPDVYGHRRDVLDGLIQRCKDLYLLVDLAHDSRSATLGTRLSHDTLAPLVRARFEDSDRPGQRARRILSNRIAEWSNEQHGATLDARDLEIVEQGLTGSRALSSLELELLDASRIEKAKRLHTQRLFKLAAGVALVTIAGLIVFGVNQLIGNQKQRAETAEARAETAEAKADAFNAAREAVDSFHLSIAENVLVNQPGMTDLRRELLSRGATFYEHFVDQFGENKETKGAVATAWYYLGRVQYEKSEYEEALKNFEKAKGIQKEQYEGSPDDARLAMEFSKTLMEIGNVNFDKGDLPDALQNFKDAVKLRKQLHDQPALQDDIKREYQMKLADATMSIGLIQEADGDFGSAEDSYTDAQDLRQNVLDHLKENIEVPAELRERKLAETHRQLGSADHNFQGLYVKMAKEAWDRVDQAENGSDQGKENEKLALQYQDLIVSHCNKAIEHFKIVLETQPNDGLVRSRLADCQISLAYQFEGEDRLKMLQSALAESETLTFYNPTVNEYKRLNASVLIEFAKSKNDATSLEKAIKILNKILAGDSNDAAAKSLLEVAGDLQKQLNETAN